MLIPAGVIGTMMFGYEARTTDSRNGSLVFGSVFIAGAGIVVLIMNLAC